MLGGVYFGTASNYVLQNYEEQHDGSDKSFYFLGKKGMNLKIIFFDKLILRNLFSLVKEVPT